MRFKRDMYLRVTDRYYRAGEDVKNISREQVEAIKEWVSAKSLKTYAHVCIHCFFVHGLAHVPYKFVRVLWNTYVNGFYKTIAANEIAEEGAEDGK